VSLVYLGGPCAWSLPFGMRNFLGVFTNKIGKLYGEFS